MKTAEQMKRPLSEHEERRLARLYSEKVERYLDAGYGSCFMKDERVAAIVRDALLHFDGLRYSLAAWCVMPNHVHVVVQPLTEMTITAETVVRHDVTDILHSWKSFSAKEANKLLHAVRYVLNNPINAGLKNWRWVGITERGKRILRKR